MAAEEHARLIARASHAPAAKLSSESPHAGRGDASVKGNSNNVIRVHCAPSLPTAIVFASLVFLAVVVVQLTAGVKVDAGVPLTAEFTNTAGAAAAVETDNLATPRAFGGMEESICRAEAVYARNMRRRPLSNNGQMQPLELPTPAQMVLRVLIPTYLCPAEERVGVWEDGGKWTCMVPSFFQSKPIVYSIGSYEKYSFEEQIGSILHTTPFTLDPFISAEAQARMRALPFLRFYAVGISGRSQLADYRERNRDRGLAFATLPEFMAARNHSYVDVLKMDCEGCESEFIRDLEKANKGKSPAKLTIHGGTLPFGQFLVEFHQMTAPKTTLRLVYALENLGYRIFHVELNPLAAPCGEISFIHESLVKPRDMEVCKALVPGFEAAVKAESTSKLSRFFWFH